MGRSAGKAHLGLPLLLAVLVTIAGTLTVWSGVAQAGVADTCQAGLSAVACENLRPGTPESVWDVDGAGDGSIQGFATQMSVNRGATVDFKIKTDAAAYRIEIYRLGWYQGNGARKVADVTPGASLPQTQPACATDPATEIYDCGTWAVSASWSVPADAVSGVYLARLVRTDTGGSSHIPFVVRQDGSTSHVVFQTSDATWQAYNLYGGSDFYSGGANGRAFKLSYNRPFANRAGIEQRDYLFANEYPMIRFLESNGYDISYISSLDTDIRGDALTDHRVFLSTGHDEYWSSGQRASVEKARDAGVNLAFFSGNEVYWRTRWENSQDGSDTPYRTLVCYKDTWADRQLDPVTSTSTWRDPRFGVNHPENALTGTLYKSNNTDLPITVSSAEGKLRLWRNTGLGNQADGTSTALAAHTIGYESDEDLDNGARPPGLIRLSTTTGPTPEYLQDYGSTVRAGTTTHHLTLYRASSGALVFGAGTIQWAWGLDQHHDGDGDPADPRLQQATVNLLADMGAVASTLRSGLTAASASTDTTAPVATITSPSSGQQLQQGSMITVSGTASDTGGRVAGVEVSLDGGSTWHPAAGRESFSYSGVVLASGDQAVQVRAIDDSANIQSPATVLDTRFTCPCSLFGQSVPSTPATADASPVTLGVRFTAAGGFATGVRFYKGSGNTGTHTGTLYRSDGTRLASVTFANETDTGWQTATFGSAVPLDAGVTYVVAYTAPQGHYSADGQYFAAGGRTSAALTAPGGPGTVNGVYTTGSDMPASTYGQTNYWVDILWSPTDTTPLSVSSAAPLAGSTSVSTTAPVSVTFSREPQAGSVTVVVTDPQGQAKPGVTTIDGRTVRFVPSTPWAAGTTYSATVTGAAPDVGSMAPSTWTFTSAQPDAADGQCPCGMFSDSTTASAVATDDTKSVELGMQFVADTAGSVTGIRFLKDAGNVGPHTVTLWTASGDRLATANVTSESTAGWQTALFDQPVAITAGTSYIASYHAPAGRYSYTIGGLAAAADRSPLHTPAGAGRYAYGTSAPQATSNANYYVDPIFTIAPGTPPVVTALSPADGATSVPIGSAITASFDQAIVPGTATLAVTDAAGHSVAGTQSSPASGRQAVFTPQQPLDAAARYTVTVSGAKTRGGTGMTGPATGSFTTAGVAACPCSLVASSATPPTPDGGDGNAVTVGTRFSVDTDGVLTGMRYFRGTAAAQSDGGTLYSASGAVLAQVSFPSDGSGWQNAEFTAPVPVTAGATYIVAVHLPNGHYVAQSAFFTQPVVNGPVTGQLGLYDYGTTPVFPTSSYGGAFYFVDVSYRPGTGSGGGTPVVSTPPAAPANVTAIPGDGSATVSWSSVGGESPVTSYTVTAAGDGVERTPVTVTGSGGQPVPTSAEFGGLTNGTAYTFTVSASNGAGTGPNSTASAPVTPRRTPGAPTGVQAVAGEGRATVSWTSPSDGGSPITGYRVVPIRDGEAQPAVLVGASTSGVVPLTATITGLTNGSSYTFTVAATNAAGTGAASDPSAATVPQAATVPGAPNGVAAVAGDGAATVTWSSPSADGGRPIVQYVVVPTSGGRAGTPLAVTTQAGQQQTATVSGLINGTAYTFTVAAVNAIGTGAASAATSPVTPVGAPGAATAVTAVAGDASATVSWTAPSNNGGRSIDSYRVVPTTGGAAGTAVTVPGTALSATVSGLINGSAYTFVVIAVTSVGAGEPSAPSAAVTPTGRPAAPTGVVGTAGDRSATVSWTAPTETGGLPITRYVVTPSSGGRAGTPVTVTGAGVVPTTARFTGLTNGTVYTFSVVASNARGDGPASAASAGVTPATVPNPPTSVAAQPGDGRATVTWVAPINNGGSPITGYVVTPYLGLTASTPVPVVGNGAGAPPTTATITGLTNGGQYSFTVAAVNSAGTGRPSVRSAGVVPVAPAFVQQKANTTLLGTSVTVQPDRPVAAGNRLIAVVGVKNSGPVTASATSVTDSSGQTWTKVAGQRGVDGTEMTVWTTPASVAARPIVTARSSAFTTVGIQLVEYAGLSTSGGSAAVDQVVVASGRATVAGPVVSGATASTGGGLALGVYLDSGSAQTAGAVAPWALRVSTRTPAMQWLIEDQSAVTGSKPQASVNAPAGANWSLATIVFRAR